MITSLELSSDILKEMIAYVAEQTPLEACGMLVGKANRAEKMIRIRNQAQSQVRFVMDPYEQLQAFDWIESQDLELVAIFHSHPTGPETVSATDILEAAYPVVHIILSPQENTWQARGFWIEDGTSREVPLSA